MLAFIKAKIWSGSGWLLALCIILVALTIIYFSLHAHYKGTDHKKLDATELTNLDNVFAAYPDVDQASGKPDTTQKTVVQREKRNQLIFVFFKNEYTCEIDSCCLKQLDLLLLGLNNKDAKLYLTNHDIIVNDFFWFVGPRTYLEVLLWALIGVLISLIYYVSLANGQALKEAGDADTGPFDVSEIAVQVSKMFYAPVCALVLVLGYNLLNSDSKMTDISIGKGLLLFAFICGFFSGRVIKFIDRLKDLVLPISDASGSTITNPTATGGNTPDPTDPSGDNNAPADPLNPTGGASSTETPSTTAPDTSSTLIPTTTVPPETSTEVAVITQPDSITVAEASQVPVITNADISVNLQLSPAAAASADGTDIIEGGFNSAVVTLQADDGGNVITLSPPINDQDGSFTAKELPFGKYTLLATMAYKKTGTIINLSASQTIAVSDTSKSFDLPLDINTTNG